MSLKVKINYCPTTGKLSIASLGNIPLIDKIIKVWGGDPLMNLSKEPFCFLIVLQRYQECLRNVNPDYPYAQDELIFSSNTSSVFPTNKSLIPIIHIVDNDLFKRNDVCRWKKIVDSSIWNQYIVYEETSIIKDLKETVKEIGKYYDEGRYSLSIAYEYGDFYARMVKQSHLFDGSAHNEISPFLFHSEKEMDLLINDLKLGEEESSPGMLKEVKKYRWRFLLLDDKGIEKMSTPKSNGQDVDICKLQIIAHNLHRILGFDEDKIWFRIIDFNALRNHPDNTEHRIVEKESQRIIEDYLDNNGNIIEPDIKTGKEKKGHFVNISNDPNNPKYVFTPEQETGLQLKDIQVIIDCVKHVDAAQYCLQKFKYEIILLDYLLFKDKVDGEQEYGYQLLEKLSDWNKKIKKNEEYGIPDEKDLIHNVYVPGPNKRFFFMFTSAFTTAVHERMLEKGFAKSERGLWYIGDGACPTNTPYLFSYQLMLLMRHRLADLMKDTEGGCMSVIDLLELIYVKGGDAGTEETRQKAHEHFNHVLFMRDKYKTLEIDFSKDDESHLKQHPNDANYILNMESSLLVQSVFKIVNHFSGAFFEHLQHLVYLTAFGTIRQWQDMWEEYVFVSKELCEYDIIVNEKEKDEKGEEKLVRRGKAVSDAIREYIINLKENNY